MKKCPYCGKENKDEGKFCAGCGKKIATVAEVEKLLSDNDIVTEKEKPENKTPKGLIVLIVAVLAVILAGAVAICISQFAPSFAKRDSVVVPGEVIQANKAQSKISMRYNDETYVVKDDGRVFCVDDLRYISGWTDITAIACGDFFVAGLKSDGTVVCTESAGERFETVSEWSDIIAISAGDDQLIGLKNDGTVVAAGYGTLNTDGWENIISVGAGDYEVYGVKSDGTICSSSDHGSAISECRDIVALSAADSSVVGLKKDGTVVAVGSNLCGECNVSDWSYMVAVSAGKYHTVGLKSDGTVVSTKIDNKYKQFDYGQTEVSDWTDIIAVYAGEKRTVGLKKDGTVVST